MSIWLELPSAVPRDTLLGKRDNDAQELTLRVLAFVPDSEPLARLGFQPTQQLPLNAYLSLERLQEALIWNSSTDKEQSHRLTRASQYTAGVGK